MFGTLRKFQNFLYQFHDGTGQLHILGIARATPNNKENSPYEFDWLSFQAVPPFLVVKEFSESTASFSLTLLKVGASFRK